MKIIDISKHNGHLNYNLAKTKVDGIMIKLSMGYNGTSVYSMDELADRNIRMCHKLGIPWGVYHYSYAQKGEDGATEARGVIKILEGYKQEGILPLLPIAIDLEDNNDISGGDHGGASWAELTKIGIRFCEEVEEAGYYAQIYANCYWFSNMGDLSRFDKWLAEWGTAKPSLPCGMWQYTSDGDGHSYGAKNPRMDENLAFVDYPSIIKERGLNGWGKPKARERPAEPTPAEPTDPEANIKLTIGKNRWFFDVNGKLLGGKKKP